MRLYSRSGDDISNTFPDLVEAVTFQGVLDGELLVKRAGEVASFNDLQQRLNRKAVTARMLEDYPAFVHLYDILFDGQEDLRALPFAERRQRLEAFFARERPPRMDVSPLVDVAGLDDLERLRGGVRGTPIEGLMLKRKDSPYLAGRPKGLWWKWKRDAHLLDVVLMYAQRGHGKRSSFYSDFTFGAWRDGAGPGPSWSRSARPIPATPTPSCCSLDRWIRDHTTTPLRPGARGDAGAGVRGRLRSRSTARPGTSPASPCASRASIDPLGQAGSRGRPAGEPGAADRVSRRSARGAAELRDRSPGLRREYHMLGEFRRQGRDRLAQSTKSLLLIEVTPSTWIEKSATRSPLMSPRPTRS